MIIRKFLETVFTIIPKKICLMALVVCVVMVVIGFGFSDIVGKIEVGDISSWYNTIINIFPNIREIAPRLLPFFIPLTIYFLIAISAKPVLVVFSHFSMDTSLGDIGKSIKKRFYIKTKESNFLNQPNILAQSLPKTEDIKKLILMQICLDQHP